MFSAEMEDDMRAYAELRRMAESKAPFDSWIAELHSMGFIGGMTAFEFTRMTQTPKNKERALRCLVISLLQERLRLVIDLRSYETPASP